MDYDAFYNGSAITKWDKDRLFREIMKQTINQNLQWKRTAKNVYYTSDWKFYAKHKSKIIVKKNKITGTCCIVFQGKYGANDSPQAVIESVKAEELLKLVIEMESYQCE